MSRLVGPRRVATVVAAGAAGLLVWLVADQVGLAWGLVLLAGVGGGTLLVTLVNHAELQRHRSAAVDRHRATVEQWQACQAELRQLQSAVERERLSAVAWFEALTRAGQQAAATAAWQQAAEQRLATGGDQRAGRDREVAMVRSADLFDPDWYQTQLGQPQADPAAHYVDWGARLGLDPHPLFASARYLERHPEALAGWRTPLGHYLATGSGGETTVRYDRHGSPDQVDLKWQYLARGLHREPDTFVLYRIVGNDLPPRHRSGQSLDNLRFILDHEPELPDCQKRWVVNRIVDPRIEKQVVALLEERSMPYLHIPFEPAAYRTVGWRFAGLQPPGLTFRREFQQLNLNQQQRVLDHVYHDKNLYVMNNNGARNAALHQGRGLAKWVLPWDGNCFLTARAWEELVAAVTARPYLKYFAVPMARVLDNQLLLHPDPVVEATEEPQLLFRRDAAEEFNPDARYGRRPKVELFYRLRLPGAWDGWGRVQWDDPLPAPSPEAGQVGEASWVARLFSGQEALEADSADRQWRRIEAIRECIDRVDVELASATYDPASLFTLDDSELDRQRDRWAAGQPGPARVVADLVARAGRWSGPDGAWLAALAGWFTQGPQLLRTGARRLHRWLRWPGPPQRIADLPDLGCLLDGVRLLARAGVLRGSDRRRLQAWLVCCRHHLVASGPGEQARSALDQRGTWYDGQVAAIDAYLGDVAGLLATLRRAHERVGQQLGPDHAQATVGNLLGWVRLAGHASRVGQDLWSYQPPGGGGLAAAVRELLERPAEPDRAEHRAVLAHLAAVPLATPAAGDPWSLRQVFPSGAGVRPFWLLGSEVAPA